MSANRIWRTMNGTLVNDMLTEVVAATTSGQRVVHVGCDSQQYNKKTEFVTVVVLLNPGKGGRVIWSRKRVKRIDSLRERLLKEVWMSVEVAMEIDGVVSDDVDITVHVDANPNTKFKSSDVLKEMVGMVVGQGFSVLTKPVSWAAMSVADHLAKHRNER